MINEYTIGFAIIVVTIGSIWGWKKVGTVMQGRRDRKARTVSTPAE